MTNTYRCNCNSPRKHRLTLDGGIVINSYKLELCDSCYMNQNKKYQTNYEVLLQNDLGDPDLCS